MTDMRTTDLLRPDDEVTVSIQGPDGSNLYESTGNGFHTLEGAVKGAISKADLSLNPEDCVFEVNNHTKGITQRYRLNAHGNLKLIV